MRKFDESELLTLKDRAYLTISDGLRSGQFEPGEKITIRGLASTLGISATPIREAIGRLVAEGAVEALPNRWMRVPLLTVEELREIRAIRVYLESRATERAASRLTQADLKVLQDTHQHIVALRHSGDVKGRIKAITAFHFRIYEAGDVPISIPIIKSLWLKTGPYINLLFPDYSKMEQGRLRGQTLQALTERKPELAAETISRDIGGALDYIIELIEKNGLISAV